MLHTICFSKDRPLQLHGYLTSFFAHFVGEGKVSVLVQSQPQWFGQAYAEVEAEFPQVNWCHEQDFRTDLDSLIDPSYEYTMFGCDDVVFVRDFDILPHDLRNEIGRSLRLGSHTTVDMFGQAMPQPRMSGRQLTWSVLGALGDWGYPWEVLGTIYETDFVQRMVARVQANSPSQLEERGSRCWSEETDKRLMSSWPEARIVVPTVNLVQQEFPNGILGNIPLDVGFLLECWKHGLRMETGWYANMSAISWRVPDFCLTRKT